MQTDKIVTSIQRKKKNIDWTDNLDLVIWKAENLPCIFSFTQGYITNAAFKFKGHCSECKTGIQGEALIDNAEKLNFEVQAFDTSSIKHTAKKRKLNKENRRSAKAVLCLKTVEEYLEEERTPYEEARFNDSKVLQKAREEALNEASNYKEFKGKSINNVVSGA